MAPKKRAHGDGGLYWLPDRKLWRGTIEIGYDADGRRLQKVVTARTQRACRDKKDAIAAEILEHGAPLDKQVNVAAWARTWLDTVARPTVDPKTYSGYAGVTRNHIVPVLGRKKIATLKPSNVRELLAAMNTAGLSTSSLRQAYVVMSLMMEAARRERLCRRNVVKDVKKPGGKKAPPAKKRSALTTTQALAILQAAAALPNSAGSRWWLKLLAGPRQGEILGATLADLDLDAGLYEVNWKLEDLRRDHGCTPACGYTQAARCPQARWRVPDDFESIHLTGAWHLTRPKSKTGRVIPLIPQLVEAIRRHVQATADLPNPHGLIWRQTDGTPIHPDQDAQEWRELLHAAGVITADQLKPRGTDIVGHVARHTTVTILASLGVDFQVIGEIVGHSSAQVTMDYRHAQSTEKAAAMAALGGVWAAGLTLPPPQIEQS